MAQTKFITINKLTLHYVREGRAGAPTLVFINSLGSDLRIWDEVIPGFIDQYSILRYDKRGHGLSDAPPAPYSIQDHTFDLAGLLSALGISQAVLIGISVGGMIALDFAYHYPEQVRGLVLSDTAPKIGTAEMWNERVAILRENGLGFLGEAILSRWFAPTFASGNPAAYQGYDNMLTRTPLAGYVGTCIAIRDADLRPQVGSIQARTLVLCGAEDLATTPEMANTLAKAMPHAEFTAIEGAAHLPCIEQPTMMVQRIDQFLQNIIK